MSGREFDDDGLDGFDEAIFHPDTALELDSPEAAHLRAADAAASQQTKRGKIYTMVARKGMDAATIVEASLHKHLLGTHTPRRVAVAKPSGPSTSAGRKARQAITLVPVEGPSPAIMIGYLDVAERCGELRPYEEVAAQVSARFGSPFDVSQADYAAFERALEGVLKPMGLSLITEEEEAEPEARTRLPPRALALAAGLLAVGVGVGVVLLLR